ncbi:CAP-Gly domain-containing linker protein 3 isoform X2 [Lingula anatina]|uniref:CAP-Gly domain-containing linker protein 3 isoform X2 n=1 Tax=Lingula anatina TaxID=7574 RepID=A0A1S3I0E9_LINAN|nr:CAP-Gly domain-containing linker protein 3 isoform X2 [Lingula anatina]|eukprot:XP_013390824.1 CAP-Gly domain-containing linker protein 3 isoform X2 [Lingula anatina]
MALEDEDQHSDNGADTDNDNNNDFCISPREKPMIHPAVEPPLCEACQKQEMVFFDPSCPGCLDVVMNPATTIAEIFAILRQWTPQTQQNVELFIKEIIKRGANINDHDGLTDMTLLHYAAKSGTSGIGDVKVACSVVNYLLDKGADTNIRCRWTAMTALHYAVYFDVAPVVKILLEASKALDVDNLCAEFEQGTPLHIAATNLSLDSAGVLLEHGANPQAKDSLGRTAIECIPELSSLDGNQELGKKALKLRKMLMEAEPTLPKLPPPNYDSIQSKVTLQAMGLKIGDKIVVGGVKTGFLRYCGPAEFATGIWAGIELEEAEGKNDGSVGGISYFKCSPKHGIFAPISKISKPGVTTPRSGRLTPGKKNINYGTPDLSRVTSKIDTGLKTKSRSGTPSEGGEAELDDRVIVAGQRKGTVRYVGETKFAPVWYAVDIDIGEPNESKQTEQKGNFMCLYIGVERPIVPPIVHRYINIVGSELCLLAWEVIEEMETVYYMHFDTENFNTSVVCTACLLYMVDSTYDTGICQSSDFVSFYCHGPSVVAVVNVMFIG